MPTPLPNEDTRAMPPEPPRRRRGAASDDVGLPRPGKPDLPDASPAELRLLDDALAVHLPEIAPGVPTRQSALLPVLHHIQEAVHYIPPALVPEIARALNLSRAEVHGVITYYHHFRSAPPGRHVVQICQAEACRSNGAVGLMAEAARQLGCAEGRTRGDGAVTLEAVYCLGLCATGPAALIDDLPRSRVDAALLARVAARLGEAG